MEFIDLFAGLGGFHLALTKLGHNCVFASEKKEILAKLYERNYGIIPNRNILDIEVNKIPKHDILCAGFPCQPFSKAGSQGGLNDVKNGNLFYKIQEILNYHKPKYFILENVRNLEKHDSGNTWKEIEHILTNVLNYNIDKNILSPHNFNIPQHRQRIFIVGSKNNLDNFKWPKKTNKKTSIFSYLDKNPKSIDKLEPEKIEVIDIWQNFVNAIPKEDKLPSWPIWSMEFGATYPFENKTPYSSNIDDLSLKKGSFGCLLKGKSKEKILDLLPSYARTNQESFPTWKKHYIRSNRLFFKKYKKELKPIIKELKRINIPSWQKFEWNIQGGNRILRKHIIQFRGSGVRVKKTDYFPSLVTVSTQIPILGFYERYITPREGARIQSLNGIKLPINKGTCFSALGNAVNVKLIKKIAENLIQNG